MLLDIDHVQLAMPLGQEGLARDFYAGVLGLEELEKPENLRKRGGVWFRIGERQFHLGVEKDFVPAKKAHPAFLVENVATLTRALQAGGYKVVNDEPLEGHDRIYTEDPFGNRLEFLRPHGR